MKKQMALYQENLEEQIGTGVICQEVAIVKENSDGGNVRGTYYKVKNKQ